MSTHRSRRPSHLYLLRRLYQRPGLSGQLTLRLSCKDAESPKPKEKQAKGASTEHSSDCDEKER